LILLLEGAVVTMIRIYVTTVPLGTRLTAVAVPIVRPELAIAPYVRTTVRRLAELVHNARTSVAVAPLPAAAVRITPIVGPAPACVAFTPRLFPKWPRAILPGSRVNCR
jgi:hypothetical protein